MAAARSLACWTSGGGGFPVPLRPSTSGLRKSFGPNPGGLLGRAWVDPDPEVGGSGCPDLTAMGLAPKVPGGGGLLWGSESESDLDPSLSLDTVSACLNGLSFPPASD